jgi:hypothetical protein
MEDLAEQVERDILYIDYMIASHNFMVYGTYSSYVTQKCAEHAMKYSIAYCSGCPKDPHFFPR